MGTCVHEACRFPKAKPYPKDLNIQLGGYLRPHMRPTFLPPDTPVAPPHLQPDVPSCVAQEGQPGPQSSQRIQRALAQACHTGQAGCHVCVGAWGR